MHMIHLRRFWGVYCFNESFNLTPNHVTDSISGCAQTSVEFGIWQSFSDTSDIVTTALVESRHHLSGRLQLALKDRQVLCKVEIHKMRSVVVNDLQLYIRTGLHVWISLVIVSQFTKFTKYFVMCSFATASCLYLARACTTWRFQELYFSCYLVVARMYVIKIQK